MTIDQINIIRESYKFWTPRSDPYAYFDWLTIFSPIEKLVWNEIRALGLPFYPQFPVSNYFIDFADPVKKIALEVDGAKWHYDIVKDDKRQKEIEKLGWKFFRVTGSQVMNDVQKQDYNEDDFDQVYESEMVLRKIKHEFYENNIER